MKAIRFRIFEYNGNDKFFKIEEDLPDVGWYLKVYDNNMNCISDHLQNDFETIIDFGLEEYGIQKNEWTEKR